MKASRLLFGPLLIASMATSADAAGSKPDYELRKKFVDVTVTLDPGVKADKPLAAYCLREGKGWAAKRGAEAKAATREMPLAFPDHRPWVFTRTYLIRAVIAGHYVSVVRSDTMDNNGAHPNSDVDAMVWDDAAKKRISIAPFFVETADGGPTMKALLDDAVDAVKAEKKARDIDDHSGVDWFKDLKPSLSGIGAVALAPSTESGKSAGLVFYYPPYAVGPYVEGSYVVFVPWDKLTPYLSPEGQAIFSGSRPKEDAAANRD